MNAKAYATALRDHLATHADPEKAGPMERYMKNRAVFFGIQSGPRRLLLREFIDSNGLPVMDELPPVIKLLWAFPERELQYVAQELLEKRRRELSPGDFPLVEFMITDKSWWDTVDFIAVKLAGSILRRHRNLLPGKFGEWLDSENLWLQRTAILCQLKWKRETDPELLATAIEATRGSREFFLRKAIGWALREFARTDPEWVRCFVDEAKLEGLSRREALKHIGPAS